jgi:hypothetical protein
MRPYGILSMDRRQFLQFPAAMAATAARPNVVVMLADDQRYDTIHALAGVYCEQVPSEPLTRGNP